MGEFAAMSEVDRNLGESASTSRLTRPFASVSLQSDQGMTSWCTSIEADWFHTAKGLEAQNSSAELSKVITSCSLASMTSM